MFAYLDPGSGSMIVQLIVGGLAAAGVAIKLYWKRLMRLLRISKPEDKAAKETPATEPAPATESDAR